MLYLCASSNSEFSLLAPLTEDSLMGNVKEKKELYLP